MKLYMVTDGRYSDYRVLGIFSTQEKADRAVQLYASENDIEEIELDEMPEAPKGMLYYLVRMDAQGESFVYRISVEHARAFDWQPCSTTMVSFYVWASDETHAVKIANEKRAMLMATGQWTTDWKVWERRQAGKE